MRNVQVAHLAVNEMGIKIFSASLPHRPCYGEAVYRQHAVEALLDVTQPLKRMTLSFDARKVGGIRGKIKNMTLHFKIG